MREFFGGGGEGEGEQQAAHGGAGAAGLHECRSSDQRRSARADVGGGEGTVGVLAPGDRDAQGLEGHRVRLTS